MGLTTTGCRAGPSALRLVDFLISCSCLSAPTLVSLVPSAQRSFGFLGPRTPELRATSRPLKAHGDGLCTARIRVTGTASSAYSATRSLAGRADPVALGDLPPESGSEGGELTPAANCCSLDFV